MDIPAVLPEHIAIVMDGNGRWAKKEGLSTAAGHKAGVEAVRLVLSVCQEANIKCLSLFAFSSENWSRPKLEVRALMKLFSSYLDSEVKQLVEKGVCLRFIGRRDRFSKSLLKKIELAEAATAHNHRFHLTLAVDYGGHWDIAEACKKIAYQVEQGKLKASAVDEQLIDRLICSAELPKPDLLIRTSGECRISNFLLWQLAYSEFYFTDTLWPDFDKAEFSKALSVFAQRDRRFGGRLEGDNA